MLLVKDGTTYILGGSWLPKLSNISSSVPVFQFNFATTYTFLFFLRKRPSRLLIQELENHEHKNYKDEQTPSRLAKEKIISPS